MRVFITITFFLFFMALAKVVSADCPGTSCGSSADCPQGSSCDFFWTPSCVSSYCTNPPPSSTETCYVCSQGGFCSTYTSYACALPYSNCDACQPPGPGPTATPNPSASPTPTPCPGQCNYFEPRQDAINTYCNSAVGPCTLPRVWRNPLTCHVRDAGGGICSWGSYGASCTSPNCDCACVMAAPSNPTSSCSADGTTATVSWNAVPEADGYFLRVNKEPYGDWWNAAGGDFYLDLTSMGTAYSFAVSPGVGYGWSVQAKAPGESYPYGGVYAYGEVRCSPLPTPTCIPTPPPPTNPLPTGTIRETVNGNFNQSFSWNLPYPFTRSYFRITADGSTDCSVGDFCPPKFYGSGYPGYVLTPGTNYIWWIHTGLDGPTGTCPDFSDAVFSNIHTCNRAFPPTGLNPPGGGVIGEDLASISWNRSSTPNLTHYYLRVDEDPQTPSDFNSAICTGLLTDHDGDVCTGLIPVSNPTYCDGTTCSYAYDFRAGHSYTYWVHEVVDGDPLCYGNAADPTSPFSATAPTPTPGPWMRINGDVHSNEDIRLPSKQ